MKTRTTILALTALTTLSLSALASTSASAGGLYGGYGGGHHMGGSYGGHHGGGFYGQDYPRRSPHVWNVPRPRPHYPHSPVVESCDCEATTRLSPLPPPATAKRRLPS